MTLTAAQDGAVRRLVTLSADDARTLTPSPSTSTWASTAGLPAEGWLVELARAHLRMVLSPQRWSHARFAAWLGLPDARAYRLLLRTPGAVRLALVELARRALELTDPERFTALGKTPEHGRFVRAYAEHARRDRHRRGRRVHALETAGPFGATLERIRVAEALSVSAWAARLGMAPMTYRKLVDRDDARLAWLVTGVRRAMRDANIVACERARRGRAVTQDEVDRAYATVWRDLEAWRERIGGTATDARPSYADDPTPGFLPLDLYAWMRDTEDDRWPSR